MTDVCQTVSDICKRNFKKSLNQYLQVSINENGNLFVRLNYICDGFTDDACGISIFNKDIKVYTSSDLSAVEGCFCYKVKEIVFKQIGFTSP